MDDIKPRTIWTIGHSTRTWSDFISILQFFSIELLVDIRAFPGSKKFPHFNKESMEHMLPLDGVGYEHFRDLGGRRKPLANSPNMAWRNESFRGYADYMMSPLFEHAIVQLEYLALEKKTAYMCSEAPWWRCHRALLSDYLKARGWNVQHIMEKNKSTEHPYTAPARAAQQNLFN